jgi:glycosyltransferase involved in cell wall biosynthesis
VSRLRLVVYTDFSYREQGDSVTAQLPFVLFINALSEAGVELSVVGRLDSGPDPLPFALAPEIELTGLPGYSSLANPGAVVGAASRTMRTFGRATAGADAVWLFGPHPFAFGFAAIAAARRQRVILGVRQNLPELIARRRSSSRWLRFSARLLERSYRLLSRRCDTVVVGADLAAAYGASRRLLNLPISLVREAQVVSLEDAVSRPQGERLTAISVGRLDPEKNPLLLADVLLELRRRDPRWHLEVYGDGTLAEPLRQRLSELGLAEFATLRGYVPVDDGLVDAYRRADALLHVSWTEGVPQVLFEAFAAGLPIVATEVGGVAEAVGDAGLLVAPGAAEPAAEALARIGSDPELRRSLIERGLNRVADRTIEQQVRRAIDFIAAG